MNRNFQNQDKCDDEVLFGIRKIPYWEIYGVKQFPYRGRRKYTPLLYQSIDGGMIIKNDLFGLTIRQFERMYKTCLERRKTHEQWILYLRYPDKSSNEYLEYLQNCTDCNKDHLLWLEDNPKNKYLYEHLVKTAGTEIDIRNRQRLFIIQNMIINTCQSGRIQISSGSLAEGLYLPGSDIDFMEVQTHVDVIQNEKNIKHPVHKIPLVMETDTDHPGFARLRLIAEMDGKPLMAEFACFAGSGNKLYLPVSGYFDFFKQSYKKMPVFQHGPCLSDVRQKVNCAPCLHSAYLPFNAIPWSSRHRRQWPSDFVIDWFMNNGCLLVPIGPPKNISDSDYLWRLSFSFAEKKLVHSFNFTQLLCYALLKLTLKRIVNTVNDVKELLCSYFLKTALFWVSEEVDIETFQPSKLFYCFSLCLAKLISWVHSSYCPNYFIPEHNMFLGKINQSNNKVLLRVLESVKYEGIDGLIQNLFLPENENCCLSSTKGEHSFIMSDFLFYRLCGKMAQSSDISDCYKGLAFTESLPKSQSSLFIIGVCKYFYAEISQYAAQLLPPPTTYNIRKCYHRHLQDGIKTSDMSSWLYYASFYYVSGQYNETLRLTDYVRSRCTPDLVPFGDNYDENDINKYIQNVHSAMTLNDRIKIATVKSLCFLRNSSLIPEELQLEVADKIIFIPPVIMCHCLRFLCYHHLRDIDNRQQALRDLHLTVEEDYFVPSNMRSDPLTILGVCYEISGNKFAAYHGYNQALNRSGCVSSTAEGRKSNLF
ncbi:uncharacterized protein LOC127717547 [Mytilus californianus]|uniref:uncharacterized protein LOC127717547 n=1 Tax=Mytilus californianus TaxID=6549 RepID=UPI002246051C|nr:uncharacterized protein LOC127717547 [Mytilus californianus]